ncbi:MAG TPA: flagellin [Acidimicrobiales bacterium]|nr:flagellin [Acidimicrobiales bacterium]
MRVADISLSQAITSQLDQQESSIATLQEQISSGRSLNKPSDDPAAVTQVLQLSSEGSQLTSWQSNAQIATSWLGMGNNAVNSVLSNLQSARTLLLQALNQGTQSSTTYQAIAAQLQGINANLLDTANTQYEGRPIFAGTSASPQAYDSAGNYLGNGDSPTVIVGPGSGAGQAADLSVPGPVVFGTGGANVFSTLSTVIGQLNFGTPTAAQLNTALTALDANISDAEQASAELGNASDAVTSTSAALTTQLTAVQNGQSSLEDVNVATVTTQLDSEMTNYQAAMWAASQAIPETLVKFL